MNFLDLILLSIAMGIDCLVVSFSQGLIFKTEREKNSLNLALTCGLFQGIMPIIGYIAASKIYNFIKPYSARITFVIFIILGLHFIFDAIAPEKENKIECIGLKCLLALGIATSIDAMVSGVSIKLTHTNILYAGILFGIFSFLMSLAGFWSGNKIKIFPPKYLKIIGGIILILLAYK